MARHTALVAPCIASRLHHAAGIFFPGIHLSSQQAALRKGFRKFFEKIWNNAKLPGRLPDVVACGSRNVALAEFAKALKSRKNEANEICILLVDSEERFEGDQPKWEFLLKTNSSGRTEKWEAAPRWAKPDGATENQVYFMVHCMEAWLLADPDALSSYYKLHFDQTVLPSKNAQIERLDKKKLAEMLNKATRNTGKKIYHKGRDSFELIAMIDPEKVKQRCPAAKEFIDYLVKLCVG